MSKSNLMPKRARCKDCGEEFVITGDEQEFFRLKKLRLPRRCVTCRRVRKELNINEKI